MKSGLHKNQEPPPTALNFSACKLYSILQASWISRALKLAQKKKAGVHLRIAALIANTPQVFRLNKLNHAKSLKKTHGTQIPGKKKYTPFLHT